MSRGAIYTKQTVPTAPQRTCGARWAALAPSRHTWSRTEGPAHTPRPHAARTGEDARARSAARHLGARGIDVANLFQLPDERTAEYAAILEPGGDLAYGIADMAIFDRMTPELLANAAPSLAAARLVFADCNCYCFPSPRFFASIKLPHCGKRQSGLLLSNFDQK